MSVESQRTFESEETIHAHEQLMKMTLPLFCSSLSPPVCLKISTKNMQIYSRYRNKIIITTIIIIIIIIISYNNILIISYLIFVSYVYVI